MTATPSLTWKTVEHMDSFGKAVSACGRYTITWADCRQGRYFNSWYGDSPRKHLTGTFDREIAKTVCEQHARKHQSEQTA